jgi:hypothetical protein
VTRGTARTTSPTCSTWHRPSPASLTPLSERVSVVGGTVLFDGNPQDGTIVDQIVRFLDDDREDWKPLVAFMENVAANPNDHSREQLYDWLRVNDLSITDDGLIVGYKGTGPGPEYLSGHSGYGVVIDGYGEATTYDYAKIPNRIGTTVEMPRDRVQHDPANACSTGLHVGTKEYANGFNAGGLLEVHVNPRDVVSVPTDAGGEKVRVSRYKVVDAVTDYPPRYSY